MKLKRLFAGLAVTVMVCAAAMSSAGAYFTDYDPASGGRSYDYRSEKQETVFTEKVVSEGKQLAIANTGEMPVNVRARVFYPAEYAQYISFDQSAEGNQSWTDGGDGWYYYNGNDGVLNPGETTGTLSISIQLPKANIVQGDEINIIAVYESKLPGEEWS